MFVRYPEHLRGNWFFACTEIGCFLQVIYDRDNGRSRGFAFVTMASEEEARVAIEKLDGLVGYHLSYMGVL